MLLCGSTGGGAVGDSTTYGQDNMTKDTDATSDRYTTASAGALPEYPGTDCLAHQAATWMENTTAVLGDLKLLAVANGREHPDAACIVDVELLPELSPEHPQYTRRVEARSRTTAQNDSNARRRYTIQMDAWTARAFPTN